MISHDYSWLGPGPGLAGVAPNDQSLPSRVQFFHQSGPYESYGGVRTTIRRRISIRVFLDGSQGRLKQLLHQKSRIWIWDLDPGSTGIPGKFKNQGIEIFHFQRMENDPGNIILLILVVPGGGDGTGSEEWGFGVKKIVLVHGRDPPEYIWFPKKGI